MNNRINLINRITSVILICVILSTHILYMPVNYIEAKTDESFNNSDNNISILDGSILVNTDLLNSIYLYYKSLYYNNEAEIKVNEYICTSLSEPVDIKEQTYSIEETNYNQESVQEEQVPNTIESKQEGNFEIELIQEAQTDSIEEIAYEKDSISYSEYEIYELAKIIMAEVEDYSQQCKEYVGQVILNRVASEQFPNNIHDVIFDGIQFSPTFDGRWEQVEPNKECYDAAYAVINSTEPITNAMYFEDCIGESWHSRNLTRVAKIDGMRFYIE